MFYILGMGRKGAKGDRGEQGYIGQELDKNLIIKLIRSKWLERSTGQPLF